MIIHEYTIEVMGKVKKQPFWLKEKAIKYRTWFSFLLTALGGIPGIIAIIKNWNKWFFVVLSFMYIISTGILFYMMVKRVGRIRGLNERITSLFNTFHKTHNTWHIYNQLSDELHRGFRIHEIKVQLNHYITTLLVNMRKSIQDIHQDAAFRFSLKMIHYKDPVRLDAADHDSYKDIPFILKDSGIRDPDRTPAESRDIIDNLDFDPATNSKYLNLKETLFYKTFVSKRITYCDKFNEHQRKISKKYGSALVAPILIHQIPLGFICLGSYAENVFDEDDRELIATFSDCISEFFRLDMIFEIIINNKKVFVLSDEELEKLEDHVNSDDKAIDTIKTKGG